MTSTLPSYKMRGVHLTAVWAFGVSQPMLSLLDNNREILLLRGVTWFETLVMVVALTVVPPLVALLYVWLAGRLSTWAADRLYLAILGGFTVPCALQLVRVVSPGKLAAIAFAGLLPAVAVFCYARWRSARHFLTICAVLPLLGAIAFLRAAAIPDAEAASYPLRSATPHPVVLVVLDEFPLASVLTQTGEIDGVRFPSLGRLARDGTWYPNATTVHEYTTNAVPALLTGRIPAKGSFPAEFHHPENLFSLMRGSYRFNVYEASSRLCPSDACPQSELRFDERVSGVLSDSVLLYLNYLIPESLTGDRLRNDLELQFRQFQERTEFNFASFLENIRASPRASLNFIHLLLPHVPWMYLPSGSHYGFHPVPGLGLNSVWDDDRWLVQQGLQRHLLQVGFTDRLLGKVIERLEQTGIYDDSLLVLVADHGASFEPGAPRRHPISSNVAEIANVPLLVKYPKQASGSTDPQFARTIDVLPTVADVLGLQLPWRADGSSLLQRPASNPTVWIERLDGTRLSISRSALVTGRRRAIRRNNAMFSEGRRSVFHIGTNVSLLGTGVPATPEPAAVRIKLDAETVYSRVSLGSAFTPAWVSGEVTEGTVSSETELAIAVNGRIRALTRTSGAPGKQVFAALVPEASFKEGFNRVDVFAVEPARAQLRFVRLGGNRD